MSDVLRILQIEAYRNELIAIQQPHLEAVARLNQEIDALANGRVKWDGDWLCFLDESGKMFTQTLIVTPTEKTN